MGFRNSKRQTFIITPFAADLPSGENLQQWPLALPLNSLHAAPPSFLLPPYICGSKCWKENKRIQRNNIWGHLSWGCHSGNSGGFWGNILLFSYYGREWETSEKHTSQLFSSKNRSRVIKVDAPPKFYSLPLSLSFPFSIHPTFPHSPPLFLLRHSSYLLGAAVLCCPLALWIINTPTQPPSCTLGQETPHIRTCMGHHDNEDHLSIKPASERTCSKA